MGFIPLVNKVYATHSTLVGLAKYSLATRKDAPLAQSRVKFGSFGDFVVSDKPRSKELSSVAAG